MDIESIRKCVQRKRFFITDHALTESFKDGIGFDDILWAINNGKIIEDYPQRERCLIYAYLPTRIYVHVVVEYFSKSELEIVTVYVPNPKLWTKGWMRKR